MTRQGTHSKIMALMLSLLTVVMSVGLSFAHCGHTGQTTLATIAAMADSGSDDDCEAERHHDSRQTMNCGSGEQCVTISTMQLMPSVAAQAVTFHFDCQLLPAWLGGNHVPEPAALAALRQLVPNTASGYYGPPRAYLRRLRVLII